MITLLVLLLVILALLLVGVFYAMGFVIYYWFEIFIIIDVIFGLSILFKCIKRLFTKKE